MPDSKIEKASKTKLVAKKDFVKNETVKTASSKKSVGLTVPVYSLSGRSGGTLELPKDLFGAEVNKSLLSQAVRIYQTNQSAHHSFTKTRGEVRGSTRKIYKQKGTGRARHGAITAPIFVGGGIALGPRPRKVTLELPEKMKKRALISALSQKKLDNTISGLTGLDKATGKTKEMVEFAKKIELNSILILTGDKNEAAQRAVKNLKNLAILDADQINAFEVLKCHNLFLTKEAVDKLKARFSK